jgi:hypothetical protein
MKTQRNFALNTMLLLIPMIEARMAEFADDDNSSINLGAIPYTHKSQARLRVEQKDFAVGIDLGDEDFKMMHVSSWVVVPDPHGQHYDLEMRTPHPWRETPEQMAQVIFEDFQQRLSSKA